MRIVRPFFVYFSIVAAIVSLYPSQMVLAQETMTITEEPGMAAAGSGSTECTKPAPRSGVRPGLRSGAEPVSCWLQREAIVLSTTPRLVPRRLHALACAADPAPLPPVRRSCRRGFLIAIPPRALTQRPVGGSM